MHSPEKIIINAAEIESKLGYLFQQKELLVLAFVHRSYVNENRDVIDRHNERLEFLGDSVLGTLIAEHLYKQLPHTAEGDLSHLRARLVEGSSCAAYLQKLDVEKYLLLGKGERMNDGRGRGSILADLFEAIIGAIYLDGGIEASRQFFFTHFKEEIEGVIREPLRNWKAELQDYAQKMYQQTPIYKVIDESGPDHSKSFLVNVFINDLEFGSGLGLSKKEAQQAAAADAYIKNENFRAFLEIEKPKCS